MRSVLEADGADEANLDEQSINFVGTGTISRDGKNLRACRGFVRLNWSWCVGGSCHGCSAYVRSRS